MGVSMILDEIAYANEILEGKHDYLGVEGVAKYLTKLYKHNKNIKDENITQDVINDAIDYTLEYLTKKDDKFNAVDNYDTISSFVKRYLKDKSPIVQIESINITKSELDKIVKLHNKHLEILAFCILVLKKVDNAKNNKQDNIFNKRFREYYYNLTKERRNNINQNKAIGELIKQELLSMPPMEDWGKTSSVFIEFIDFEEKDIEIKITDFREIALEYLKWKGENIGVCNVCGRLIEIESPTQIYCKSCAKKNWNEYNKTKQREYYNKNKNSV